MKFREVRLQNRPVLHNGPVSAGVGPVSAGVGPLTLEVLMKKK